jgi:hypothetical protein
MTGHGLFRNLKPTIYVLAAVLAALSGFAQPNRSGFRFERIIVPGGAGPNRLDIDVPLLAGGSSFRDLSRDVSDPGQQPLIVARNGLSDLRIYDARNREVPYLLIAPPRIAPRWAEARLLAAAPAKKSSGFEMDFGRPLAIDCLHVTGIPAPFMKRLRLEGSGDRSRWTVLAEDGTLFDMPAEKLSRLELEFESGTYRYLRVTWDDATSARVSQPAACSARLVTAGALPPALRVDLQYERRRGEPGVSRYRVRLPGAHLPVTAIELACAGGNVLRQARISEGRLANDEIAPQMLGLATLWHTVKAGSATAVLRIPIAAPEEAALELTIQDGDNPPLDLKGISAVFAYLPWIYFESPGTESLTARYGDPGLAAPQYDLEAMRTSAAKQPTVRARWGELKTSELRAEADAGMAVSSGAAVDVGSFRTVRPIPAGRIGLNALLLDAAVLAHSDMSDLRIVAPDGRQIPYLLEKRDEPLAVDLPTLAKTGAPAAGDNRGVTASATRSYYRVLLPYPNLPPARLVLTTGARIFRRSLHLMSEKDRQDLRQESGSVEIAAAGWSHADPDASAPPLVLRLPSLKTAEALLIVDEGDNSPLKIDAPRLLLPGYRLRFFRESDSDLKLCYGNDRLALPRYDLALLAPRLIGAPAEEISFAPEDSAYKTAAGRKPLQGILFWSILGAAVVILLLLIARLLISANK